MDKDGPSGLKGKNRKLVSIEGKILNYELGNEWEPL